jgi:transposase
MGEFPRKSDGRRVFTVEFKRGVVQQLLKGEKTLAEVSRELDIQPSVVRQWKRRFEAGATAAVATNQDVVPVSALREAHQRIRELERLLGKKQMEIEILQAAQEVVKKCMVRPRHATASVLMEETVCANVSGLSVERRTLRATMGSRAGPAS